MIKEIEDRIIDRNSCKEVLLEALKVEQEKGKEEAFPYYEAILNKLGICFHYQRRVRQFMLNQIDNAFDYFEDFNNSEYRIYLGAVLYKTEKDIGAYYTGGLNNPKYLESLIKTLNVVRNKLNEEKEFTR